MLFPNPIGGGKKSVAWLNKLRAAAMSCRIKSVIGGRLIQSSDGVSLEFVVPPSGGSGAIRMYQLMSESSNYTVCRTLRIDRTGARTVGPVDLYIAKPPELRHSILEEVIAGETFSYSYTNEHERISTIEDGDDEGLTETQVINPYYLPHDEDNDGSIIYAHDTLGTGVWREVETDVWEQLTLLEITGREWAEKNEE